MCCSVFDSGGTSVKICGKKRMPLTKKKKMGLNPSTENIYSGVSLYFLVMITTATGKHGLNFNYITSLHLKSNVGITFIKRGTNHRKNVKSKKIK